MRFTAFYTCQPTTFYARRITVFNKDFSVQLHRFYNALCFNPLCFVEPFKTGKLTIIHGVQIIGSKNRTYTNFWLNVLLSKIIGQFTVIITFYIVYRLFAFSIAFYVCPIVLNQTNNHRHFIAIYQDMSMISYI